MCTEEQGADIYKGGEPAGWARTGNTDLKRDLSVDVTAVATKACAFEWVKVSNRIEWFFFF